MGIITLDQELIPSAKRLMKSLRDIGYDFAAAVADVIDNSITADAHEIDIDVEFDGDHSKVRIADNGNGMNREQLIEAMRFGSEIEYEVEDLGKFGLGMKTASLSQCRKLSVATKSDGDKTIYAFCWDFDHVEKTNRWEILVPNKKELEKILNGHLADNRGTVVFWQFLDKMLGQKHPYSETSRKRLLRMSRELEEHVTMVFHRFMADEVPGKKLTIRLNGNELKPWDPFARDQEHTIKLETIVFNVVHDDAVGEVRLEPYILPTKDRFEPPSEFDRASGPRKWNDQQGFYIYRANRLIRSGGWCGLRAADEHTKLARISLDFSPQLDDAFNINVAKMRVKIPEEIREELDRKLEKIVKRAREIYDKKDRPKPQQAQQPASPAPSELPQGRTATQATFNGNEPARTTPASFIENVLSQSKWTFDEIKTLLEENAYGDEIPIIQTILKRVRKKIEGLGKGR